jgi:NitT/TauT family transport system permease protein
MDQFQNKDNHRSEKLIRKIDSSWSTVAILSATVLLFLFIWYGISHWTEISAFILPSPEMVWRRFLASAEDGSIIRHSLVTLEEVMGGLAIGISIALLLGYLLAKSRVAEKLLSPYIVASQSIPIVAIAPLLIIWFGSGRLSKVLISALIVFFPILVNTIIAVRSVPQDLHDLMRSLQASRWQVFFRLEAPAAMPLLLGGLKVGATLSVIGAVVGEFVAADEGLGFAINLARGMYDIPMVFVAVFALVAMALILYGAVSLLEHRLLVWRRDATKK